jgi:hypothetical protein
MNESDLIAIQVSVREVRRKDRKKTSCEIRKQFLDVRGDIYIRRKGMESL